MSRRPLTLLALALAAGISTLAEEPQALLAGQRLEARRAILGLSPEHGFRAAGMVRGEDGSLHCRFQQVFRGVRVWGGDAIVHLDREGRELQMTDALQRGIATGTEPALAEAEVLSIVDQALLPKGAYAYAPTAELVLVPRFRTLVDPRIPADRLNAAQVARVVVGHDLAWHVHTELENGTEETAHTDFFIDARTGAVLKRWSSLRTTGATGTGNSQYSGTVTLNTNSTGSGYELVDTTRGTGAANAATGKAANATYDLAHAAPQNSLPGTLFTDADDTWGDGANYTSGGSVANNQTAAVDAHYGLQVTWDMYKNVLGRNGIDGNGKATYSRVHYSNNYDNAFWSDSCFCMTYGDGSSFTVLTSLDVAGHEMSHGVCANTAQLVYSDESGGLNESNSDIFGTMVEFYAKGAGAAGSTIPDTGGNWTIGEQLHTPPLRYMYKPSLDGISPDAWSPSLGGLNVHYSSGPNNRAFYFLSQGASSDSSSNFYSSYLPAGMTGVGNQKAAKIWFEALKSYLTPTSSYVDARHAAVRAAAALYGSLSPEYLAVQNAYHAINVGPAADGTTLEDLTPPTLLDLQSAGHLGTVTLTAHATDDRAMGYVAFYVDGGLAGTVSGAGPAFALNVDSSAYGYGSHEITAVAVDANGNVSPVSAPLSTYFINGTSQGLLNGGFENRYDGWVATAYADIITAPYTHGGSLAAWLGGYGQTNSDTIYQTVSLPANATGLSLSYWLLIDTNESTASAKDTLKVMVVGPTGATTLASYSNMDAPTHGSYVQHTVDLLPYKGQQVKIQFQYAENASLATSFLLDDVSLTESAPAVTVSASSSTANVRKGATKTFTATVANAPDTSVTWSIQEGAAGGAITSGGVYTAPATLGTYHIVATSVADPSKSATITVKVINSPDLNASGKVDGIDLGLLAFKYGASGAGLAEDLDGDNAVGDSDIDLMLSEFGN